LYPNFRGKFGGNRKYEEWVVKFVGILASFTFAKDSNILEVLETKAYSAVKSTC
jgi:hypothetical protein